MKDKLFLSILKKSIMLTILLSLSFQSIPLDTVDLDSYDCIIENQNDSNVEIIYNRPHTQ